MIAKVCARLTGADETPSRTETRNGVIHVVALSLTRTADALMHCALLMRIPTGDRPGS
jgi:hypothetical protein